MTTREKRLTDYLPQRENANKGTPRGDAALEQSIREYGLGRSILVDKDGETIGGAKTLQKAVELGFERAIEVDADGNTLIVVRRTDLDLDQDIRARALAIADNRVGELDLSWDASVLAGLQGEVDLSGLFFPDELQAILDSAAPPSIGGAGDEGEWEPEAEGETRTKPGDLWQIGPHRLIVGDCTDPAVIEQLMQGELADLIFEDPPYNVSYQDNESIASLKARNRRTDGKVVENDSMSDEEFDRFLDTHFFTWPLAPGGTYYLCAPPGHPETQFRNALNRVSGCGLRQCIVWVKDRFVFGRQDYHWRHESILYGWKEGAAHYFVNDRTQDTVWEIERPTASPDHPTQKPLELPRRAIRNSSRNGAIVFDGFAGSGTTLIAAHELGRVARVCELSPRYADVILNRASAAGLTVARHQD